MTTRTDSPEWALRRAQLTRALESALGDLPAEDRLLLRYRFEDERSVREIKDLLLLPSVFHVYRRLKKVLKNVRATLEERGLEGPCP